MLTKAERIWANDFYYKSLGMSYPDGNPSPESEEKIKQDYKELYVHPVSFILRGEVGTSLSDPEIDMLDFALKSVPELINPLHFLPIVQGKPELEFLVDPKDLVSTFKKFVEFASQAYKVFYAATGKERPFKVYVDKADKVIGKYPTNIVLLGEASNFKQPPFLSRLTNIPPSILNDYCVQALKNAVREGILDPGELRKEKYKVVVGDKVEEIYVNAVSPNLPSYFVRKLISDLPSAVMESAVSPYHAALEYAEQHSSEYRVALHELRELVGQLAIKEPVSAELNDEVVMQYLNDRFGIPISQLEDVVMIPTAKKLYTSSYLMTDAEQQMSAEEFVSYVNDNPDAATGTLDEIIEAFCRQEGFSTGQSIENLIRFINDEPLIEESAESVTTTQPSIEIPSYEQSGLSVFDAIDANKHLGQELKALIKKALLYEEDVNVPTIVDVLAPLKLPEDLLSSIKQAALSGEPLVIPKGELEAGDVADFLAKKGFPRIICAMMARGEDPSVEMVTYVLGRNPDCANHTLTEFANEVEHEEAPEISELTVADFLEKHGIPRMIASKLAVGEIPTRDIVGMEIGSDNVIINHTLLEYANGMDHEEPVPSQEDVKLFLANKGIDTLVAESISLGELPIRKILAIEMDKNPDIKQMQLANYVNGDDSISVNKNITIEQIGDCTAIPVDIRMSLIDTFQTGVQFKLPTNYVIQKLEELGLSKAVLNEVMIKAGLPGAQSISDIASFASTLKSNKGVSDDMANAIAVALSTFDKQDVDEFLKVDKRIETREDGWVTVTPISLKDDLMFQSSVKLLEGVRELLNRDYSNETRDDAVNVFYAILYVVAQMPADKDAVIEYLKGCLKDVKSPELQRSLENAIHTFEQQ